VLAVVYFLLWQQLDPTQPGPVPTAPLLGDSWSLFLMVLKTCLMLGFVAALAFITLRFLPRFVGIQLDNQIMKVVARYPLEPQKSLYIVEVPGKHLLLGVSQERIELISELESNVVREKIDSVALEQASKPSFGTNAVKEFSKYLRR
jgi:flagellar protein FliO/FliZ